MDAYDVCEHLNSLLNLFALTRIAKQNDKITVKNINIRASLTIFLFVAVTIISFVLRYVYFYKWFGSVPIMVDLFQTIAITFQITSAIFLTANEADEPLSTYFKIYEQIDELLKIHLPTYLNERRVCNKLISIFGATIVLIAVFNAVVAYMIYGPYFTLACSFYAIFTSITNIQYWKWIISLKIFENRLSIILADVSEILKPICIDASNIAPTKIFNFDEDIVGNEIDLGIEMSNNNIFTKIRRLTQCYWLLSYQCHILNKLHGVELLIAIANTIFNLTVFSFTAVLQMILYYSNTYACLMVITMLFRGVYEATLLVLLLREAVIIQRLRSSLMLTLDCAIADRQLDPSDASCVAELSDMVQRQTLKFTANDYFSLDYDLFQNIITTLITYTIILTQMNS